MNLTYDFLTYCINAHCNARLETWLFLGNVGKKNFNLFIQTIVKFNFCGNDLKLLGK